MPFLEWSDQIAVGHAEIDAQHRKLVEIANALYDAMTTGKGRDHVGKTLAELIDYTVYHFAVEEDLMDRYGYDKTDNHKNKHNDFVARVQVLQRDYEAGKLTVIVDTMSFLQSWLVGHIMGTDKHLAAFLNERT